MNTKVNWNILWDTIIISSSFVIAFATVSSYHAEQRPTLSLGIFLAILGCFFFVTFTVFLNKLLLSSQLGQRFIEKYDLKLSEALEISNKTVSGIQSILSCLFGFLVCSYSCRRDFLTTNHIFSESYAWFGCSYFFYDIYSMYIVHNAKLYDKLEMKSFKTCIKGYYEMIPSIKTGELTFFKSIVVKDQKLPSFWDYIKITKLMVFHHMFIGTYGLVVISSWRGGLGDCVFSFLFLMEFSTPFVSLRSILSIMKLKKTQIYFWNGIIMLASFTIFRIMMLPYILYYYSTVVKLSFVQAVLKLPNACKLSIIALFLPQFYWFFLMSRAAARMISKHRQPDENNHKTK